MKTLPDNSVAERSVDIHPALNMVTHPERERETLDSGADTPERHYSMHGCYLHRHVTGESVVIDNGEVPGGKAQSIWYLVEWRGRRGRFRVQNGSPVWVNSTDLAFFDTPCFTLLVRPHVLKCLRCAISRLVEI